MTKPHSDPQPRKDKRASESRHPVHVAIADAIGEYRKQIADIRARHGRKRKSILGMN